MKTPLLIVAGVLVFVCGLVFASVQSVPKTVGLSAEEVAKANAKVSADKKAAAKVSADKKAADAADAARMRRADKKYAAEVQAYEKARAKEEANAKAEAAAAERASQRADCLQLAEVRIEVYNLQLEPLQEEYERLWQLYVDRSDTASLMHSVYYGNKIKALEAKINNARTACG